MRCSAALGNGLVIEYAQFHRCSPGLFHPQVKSKPQMAQADIAHAKIAADSRKMKLPAWIFLPAICACAASALIVWETGSLALGLLAAVVGAAATAWSCEQTLRDVVNTISQIAGGDRYAALPLRVGG